MVLNGDDGAGVVCGLRSRRRATSYTCFEPGSYRRFVATPKGSSIRIAPVPKLLWLLASTSWYRMGVMVSE
jgi:hypothetical protein